MSLQVYMWPQAADDIWHDRFICEIELVWTAGAGVLLKLCYSPVYWLLRGSTNHFVSKQFPWLSLFWLEQISAAFYFRHLRLSFSYSWTNTNAVSSVGVGKCIERGGTGIYSQLTSAFRFLMALTNRCMLSFVEKSNKQDFIDITTELFIGCNAAVLSRIVATGTMPQHSCSPQVVFLRAANDALLREARNAVNRFSNDPDLVSSAGAPIKRLWPRSTRLFLNTRRRKTSLVTGVWGNRESGAVGWPLFHGQLLWGRNLCSGPEGRTWSWYVAARIWWNLFGAFLYFDVVAF